MLNAAIEKVVEKVVVIPANTKVEARVAPVDPRVLLEVMALNCVWVDVLELLLTGPNEVKELPATVPDSVDPKLWFW